MSEWKSTKLAPLVSILNGFAFDSKFFTEGEGKPLLRIRDLKNTWTEIRYAGNYRDDFIVNTGDLLIGMDGDFETVRWKGGEVLLNQRVCKLTTKQPEKLSERFLFYRIINEIQNINAIVSATTVKHLSSTDIANIEIHLPSLEEQTQIAAVLSCIDRAIEHTEALIAKQQRIKTGLMQDLLTKGIDEHGNIRSEATHEFKDSPLGRIPKEWEVEPLSACADAIDPQPDHRTPPAVMDGIPYIGISDTKENGEIDTKLVRKVSVEAFRKQKRRFVVESGDIIFGKIGTIGLPKLLPAGMDYALSANVILIKPYQHSNFLYWFLVSPITTQQVLFEVRTTSQPAFGIEKIRQLEVVHPPIPEQKLISSVLDRHERTLKSEKQKLAKYKLTKQGLMQDLLTGKVSVSGLLAESAAGIG